MKFTAQSDFEHARAGLTGVLMANLGTPDSCRVGDVRRYLREFLMDPRVVEAPRALWWLALNGVILNLRPRRTARAYAKIWTQDGSPLLTISRRQQHKLQAALNAMGGDGGVVGGGDGTHPRHPRSPLSGGGDGHGGSDGDGHGDHGDGDGVGGDGDGGDGAGGDGADVGHGDSHGDHGDGDDVADDAATTVPIIELGMRYGKPSIADALRRLRAAGMRRLLVLPLYPQYCAATTASTLDAVAAELRRWRWLPALRFVANYHDHPAYIAALAAGVRDYWRAHGRGDVLLMSFHGIPQAYFAAGDPYHCECQKTARLLAEALGLGGGEWRLSFQSRLGRGAWLRPYTDRVLVELAQAGARDVQVVCPGFSADCLETLEEMALAGRDVFLQAGGTRYGCVPCLNDGDAHIDALAAIVAENLRGWCGPPATAADLARQKQRAIALGARA